MVSRRSAFCLNVAFALLAASSVTAHVSTFPAHAPPQLTKEEPAAAVAGGVVAFYRDGVIHAFRLERDPIGGETRRVDLLDVMQTTLAMLKLAGRAYPTLVGYD